MSVELLFELAQKPGRRTYCSFYEERERSINLTASWAETETFKFGSGEVVGGVSKKEKKFATHEIGSFFLWEGCPNRPATLWLN
jgi:hypothetical protein